MKAIDLYSGIGGWTLGLKMSGIKVLASYEWWKDANHTHNKNFGTTYTEKNIRKLDLKNDLPDPDDIQFVVGSPPCTQFSFANRGGNGNLTDGLIDIYKFLEVVEYINPKYWAMENVPRVAGILKNEIQSGGALERFVHLFKGELGIIKVFNSADYGVPQSRKRMIAGRFPHKLFESYQTITPRRDLRIIIDGLKQKQIIDPIYGHKIDDLTDHVTESPLTEEEKRINRDAKTHHPVYNKMSFPDELDKPSRTITALCTRVSRESIIIEDKENEFRRLSVRERGCIQTFPADYQYYSNSYSGKLKMIGNAIPPLLSYYIAQSMLENPMEDINAPESKGYIVSYIESPKIFDPEIHGSKYPWNRSFWLAIPGLRFGSGVRFELRNISKKEIQKTYWQVNFFYGNSKKIKQLPLNRIKFEEIWDSLLVIGISGLDQVLTRYIDFISKIDLEGLQEHWTNKDRNKNSPIWLIDEIGKFASELIESLNKLDVFRRSKLQELTGFILRNGNGQIDNKKLINHSEIVISGILIGTVFNILVSGEKVQLNTETIMQ